MSQPKSNEELMTEFDKQQRLFLAGKLHSTKWNVWFKDVLAQKDAEVAEVKSKLYTQILDIVENEEEMGVAPFMSRVLDKIRILLTPKD